MKHRALLLGCLLGAIVLVGAPPAWAGGVIIHGKTSSTAAMTSGTIEGAPGTNAPMPAQGPLTATEQDIYLLASLIFNGHDAAQEEEASLILGGGVSTEHPVQGEVAGGCAGAPVSGLGALAMLGLLLHRRRR